LIEDLLTEEERMVRDSARAFADQHLMPVVRESNRHETYDRSLMRRFGEAGLLGPTIHGYGCAGVSYVAYGLIAREVERVDSAYRSAMSVQSSLVMYPIYAYGTEEQRRRYLPKLASGEWVGAFGLTEPDAGSDPGSMKTRAKKVDGGYVLNGAKMWITSAPIADVMVVWAKTEDDKIRGFVVERGDAGLSTPKIEGKFSLRAWVTGEIVLADVHIPEDRLLPHVEGLRGPLGRTGTPRASTASTASSSAARSHRRSFSRRSLPICRPRSRSGSPPRSRPGASWTSTASLRKRSASSSATTAARRSRSLGRPATCTAATASRTSMASSGTS
jgi:glutaryl-CoA dehydrogenase